MAGFYVCLVPFVNFGWSRGVRGKGKITRALYSYDTSGTSICLMGNTQFLRLVWLYM